ncbi:MAG: DUF4910 domain-containing protein [Alphaproteobacteria bacterium]|nr:DUF4910 domain-containing protein [Alphaproteobacteria bacterium]
MYALAERLFPICRSITGNGVRETLEIIQEHLPDLKMIEVPSGTKCFDWTVPLEWNIRDAFVIDPTGRKIVDFQENNLHAMGYSIPVDTTLSLDDLQKHLHSLPDMPDAIPYVTSYYKEAWGICLSHKLRESLKPGDYQVRIDSTLAPGSLTYGELIIPGQSDKEIFVSTYVCHPSMANNELSGPVVATYLARWVSSLESRRYTYRFVFAPETIGSLVYLQNNLETLRAQVVTALNLTCLGSNFEFSYLPSRHGGTLADRVALHVLRHFAPNYNAYSFLDRGSDERQYCSPGVDLPMVSLMRGIYGNFPGYHTSEDDLSFISPEGLGGGYQVNRLCLQCLEGNAVPRATKIGEPRLDQYGLFPTTSGRGHSDQVRNLLHLLAYADGTMDLLGIADLIGIPFWELADIAKVLEEKELLVLEAGTTQVQKRE